MWILALLRKKTLCERLTRCIYCEFSCNLTVTKWLRFDEKIMIFNQAYMSQFYKDILSDQNIEKFDDYFTKDCTIQINGKEFTADQFKQRMKWLKEHTKTIKVQVVNFFASKDDRQITDTHISHVIDKKGVELKVFVLQQSKIENNKIKQFIDASYVMEGDKDTTIITAH